jgi:hypothetical protein
MFTASSYQIFASATGPETLGNATFKTLRVMFSTNAGDHAYLH